MNDSPDRVPASPSKVGDAPRRLGEAGGRHNGEPFGMTRQHFRAVAVPVAAAVAALVCACSGGTPTRSDAGRREDPNSPDATIVQMIACFRQHGLPNFPDPVFDPNDGRWHLPNERTEITAEVRQACSAVMPHVTPASPVPSAQLHDLLQYAQCIRTHGVPAWPDPTVDGVFVTDIDPKRDTTLQAAQPACEKYLGSSGGSLTIRSPR
jgi:hypothetical protein